MMTPTIADSTYKYRLLKHIVPDRSDILIFRTQLDGSAVN